MRNATTTPTNETAKGNAMGWKVLGTNDDRETCECCGKTGLKRVVWLESEAGDVVAYGTESAARALQVRGTKAEKTRKFAELALETKYEARREVFRTHCRLAHSHYIPRDFNLGEAFRRIRDAQGADKAMEKAIIEGAKDRIRRWPVTA